MNLCLIFLLNSFEALKKITHSPFNYPLLLVFIDFRYYLSVFHFKSISIFFSSLSLSLYLSIYISYFILFSLPLHKSIDHTKLFLKAIKANLISTLSYVKIMSIKYSSNFIVEYSPYKDYALALC